ncbi:lamin tail domain-containing protein [Streptomyces sp. H28]|uniref:lamin tail domain-containing protein n=1 Tax=Streptomyces sp. H28 TaxID=2775865 RepID=UPI00177B35F0|nr:lamin tail domain-containing protein [Streptomyces sp. H28]MBD9731852.1 lamin tail domain-containing protein [Streptomyces sp. H28]
MSKSTSVNARRLTAAVLSVGALTAVLTAPASAAEHRPHRPAVQITDVQYNAPGPDTRDNRSVNGEWVRITNTTRHAVNLRGWTLRNEEGQRYRFDNVRLAGRSSIHVHTGIGRDTRTRVFQDRRNHIWDNRSDTATLRNDRGRVVDTESWGRGRSDRDDRRDDRRAGDDRRDRDDRRDNRDSRGRR